VGKSPRTLSLLPFSLVFVKAHTPQFSLNFVADVAQIIRWSAPGYSIQVAQLWQRDRTSWVILGETWMKHASLWVNLRLNLRLKGYVSRQNLWPLNKGMVMLQLCSRKFSHCDFIRLKLNFIFFKHKIAFWATVYKLRGNVCTSSIARWKARSRLPICQNWTFSLSLTVETL